MTLIKHDIHIFILIVVSDVNCRSNPHRQTDKQMYVQPYNDSFSLFSKHACKGYELFLCVCFAFSSLDLESANAEHKEI